MVPKKRGNKIKTKLPVEKGYAEIFTFPCSWLFLVISLISWLSDPEPKSMISGNLGLTLVKKITSSSNPCSKDGVNFLLFPIYSCKLQSNLMVNDQKLHKCMGLKNLKTRPIKFRLISILTHPLMTAPRINRGNQ